jgi:exodeoxyribonuclease-5
MKEVNPTNLLEKLKSITDINDTGVNSDVNPIISADTKKDQELLKKANNAIKNTKYELFPNVYANKEQTEALDKLTDFLNSPKDKSEKTQSTFVLVGRGGTGKTTIVKKIVDEFPGSKVVGGAISHTAKNNLKKSLKGKNVRTIASLTGIGVFKNLDEFKDTTLAKADIIIIDECSMIDKFTMDRIYKLANPNAKIILMGDNVQLPPINEKDSPTFNSATKPEYNAKLTERMRQGEDSPIVPLSDIVAENIEREEKQIERKVIKRRDSNFNPITNKGVIFTENNNELMSNLERDFKADVQNTKIITYTNDNRQVMNEEVRNILWGADAKNEYNVGEILVADDNLYVDNKLEITNGEYYEVQSIKPINDAVTIDVPTLIPGKGVQINKQSFPGYSLKVKVISETDNFNKIITLTLPNADSKQKINNIQESIKTANQQLFYKNKNVIPDVNYGYAITSHKSQGSTYDAVVVDEKDIMSVGPTTNKNKSESVYTALTRARNITYVISQTQVENIDVNINTLNEDINSNKNVSKPTSTKVVNYNNYQNVLKENNLKSTVTESEFNLLSEKEKETLIWQAKNCNF